MKFQRSWPKAVCLREESLPLHQKSLFAPLVSAAENTIFLKVSFFTPIPSSLFYKAHCEKPFFLLLHICMLYPPGTLRAPASAGAACRHWRRLVDCRHDCRLPKSKRHATTASDRFCASTGKPGFRICICARYPVCAPGYWPARLYLAGRTRGPLGRQYSGYGKNP